MTKKAAKKTAAKKSTSEKVAHPKEEIVQQVAEGQNPINEDAENDEEFELGEDAGGAGMGSAAGLMAALNSKMADTAAGSFKNFRSHPDIENFYRFVYENDLRIEALQILEENLAEKQSRKKLKIAKAKAN